MAYEKRRYRSFMGAEGLVTFEVMVKETDLWISALSDLTDQALPLVKKYRRAIEHYIRKHPEFLTSLAPLEVSADSPELIRTMAAAGETAGVGPMAAVAGAIAEFVGRDLMDASREIIVENGGDIFLASAKERTVSIYAGKSRFSHRMGVRVKPEMTPLGICTSSGTVGHSLSFGKCDAVTVLSASASLADAAATAAGNRVKSAQEIQKGLDFLAKLPGILGGLIIVGESMGAWGDLELVEL